MLKTTLFLLTVSLMLTSCASGKGQMPALMPLKPIIPANLLQPCPARLPNPEAPTFPAMLDNHVQIAEIYFDCKKMHDDLIEASKKISG